MREEDFPDLDDLFKENPTLPALEDLLSPPSREKQSPHNESPSTLELPTLEELLHPALPHEDEAHPLTPQYEEEPSEDIDGFKNNDESLNPSNNNDTLDNNDSFLEDNDDIFLDLSDNIDDDEAFYFIDENEEENKEESARDEHNTAHENPLQYDADHETLETGSTEATPTPLKEKTDKTNMKTRFLDKWEKFKQQARSEIGGGKDNNLYPQEETDPQEETEEPTLEEQEDKKGKNKQRKPRGRKNFITTFYKSLINTIFNLIDSILNILGSIPIIGKPFKFFKNFTKSIRIIANSIPLMILIGVLFFFNHKSVNGTVEQSFPDNGSTTFTDFSYENGQVTGTIINTGDVISKVTPVFETYALNPSINPKTWFIPEKQGECVGSPVEVGIDDSQTVTTTCSINGAGKKVSGRLS